MPDIHAKSTVLVVEDQMLVRMQGTDILEDAGFRVLEASNADEALVILGEHDDIGLLFSDIDMPGSMDGLALAHRVNERWPNVRLLLTSGHHQPLESSLPDHGQFVRKPWTQLALLEKVQDVLGA